MNPSEEITEMVELHLPLGDHCFVYVDEELTIQMSIKSIDPVALVSTFVSYMKAVGCSLKEIEIALYEHSELMMALRTPSSNFTKPKE
jgi:hypothetical protein